MGSFPSNGSNDRRFWRVDDIGNERSEVATNAAKRISHKGTICRCLLQWFADDVKTMVNKPVFHDAME